MSKPKLDNNNELKVNSSILDTLRTNSIPRDAEIKNIINDNKLISESLIRLKFDKLNGITTNFNKSLDSINNNDSGNINANSSTDFESSHFYDNSNVLKTKHNLPNLNLQQLEKQIE